MASSCTPSPQLRVVHPPVEAEKGKPRPRLFRALGKGEPPAVVEAHGQRYELLEVLKHDSWAATAIYQSPQEKIICKFNRQQSIGFLPMRWLGRRLAARENYLLRRLSDLANIPAWRGPVSAEGRVLPHAAAHVFVEGHPLQKGDQLDAAFFEQLQATLQTMHARGIAYVDLHKAENILVGDDGRSYLIDFQVCFIRPRNSLLAWAMKRVEVALQQMDHYHYRKHLCTHRPDLAGCTLEEFKQGKERPWWLNVHRTIAVPLRSLRRRLLVALGIRKGKGQATTEHFAEDAVRRQLAAEQPRRAA